MCNQNLTLDEARNLAEYFSYFVGKDALQVDISALNKGVFMIKLNIEI